MSVATVNTEWRQTNLGPFSEKNYHFLLSRFGHKWGNEFVNKTVVKTMENMLITHKKGNAIESTEERPRLAERN